MITEQFGKGKNVKHPNDKVYTPENVVKEIMKLYDLNNAKTIYDPFAGTNKVFFNNFPKHTKNYWTEIDLGKDFFNFHEQVDWIITNPPYSKYPEVMEHSFKIADNIVYVLPISKVVSSLGRLRDIEKYGGIVSIHYFSASKAGFPFGFPCAAIYFKKGYKGKTIIKEILQPEYDDSYMDALDRPFPEGVYPL